MQTADINPTIVHIRETGRLPETLDARFTELTVQESGLNSRLKEFALAELERRRGACSVEGHRNETVYAPDRMNNTVWAGCNYCKGFYERPIKKGVEV